MRTYILVLLVAAIVTFVCTPIIIFFSRSFSILKPLRERDVHSQLTPRLGGVAMFIGALFAFFLASTMSFFNEIFSCSTQIWGACLAATILLIIGIIDDIYGLDWMIKLGGQIIASATMAVHGIQITSLPIGGIILGSSTISLAFTILFTLITINAMNFIDGLDGLAAGVACISGVAFLIYAYLFSRHQTPNDYSNTATLFIAVMIGICLGFLPHNFYPAHIFMGDAGSMLLGFFMAVSSIILSGQVDPKVISQTEMIPVFMPIVLPLAVIALPLFDMITAVIRRTKIGIPPTSPDKMHLHHKMLQLGHTHMKSVLILYIWAGLVAFGNLAFAFFSPTIVISVDIICLGVALLLTLKPCREKSIWQL